MTGLRVATIGAGYFARFHHEAWARMEDVELIGVCDRDRARAEGFAKEFSIPAVFGDVDEMLDEITPDIVDIITPPFAHKTIIESLVGRGINAICQKPFCTKLKESEDIASLAADKGVTLVVHENFRFQPWYEVIKRELDAGRVGQVYQATFRLRPGDGQGEEAYLDRQPYFRTMPRFLMHETAIHLIDTFRYLFGEPTSVYADLDRLNPAISGEDAGIMMMQHEGGVRSLFDGNRLVDHTADNRRLTMGEMLIEGEAGVLALDGDARIAVRATGGNDWEAIDYEWSDSGFGGDCVYRCNRHVVEHFVNDAPLVNSATDYLANLRVEEAVYLADRWGHKMKLPRDETR